MAWMAYLIISGTVPEKSYITSTSTQVVEYTLPNKTKVKKEVKIVKVSAL